MNTMLAGFEKNVLIKWNTKPSPNIRRTCRCSPYHWRFAWWTQWSMLDYAWPYSLSLTSAGLRICNRSEITTIPIILPHIPIFSIHASVKKLQFMLEMFSLFVCFALVIVEWGRYWTFMERE